MLTFQKKYFTLLLALILVETFIAIYIHDAIIRPYIGDLLATIGIYCFVKTFFRLSVLKAAIGALIFSYIVEFSQYFKIVKLLGWQHSKAANILIGNSFSWTDILCYTIGALIVLGLEKLSNKCYLNNFK
jgi:hypothetical protein